MSSAANQWSLIENYYFWKVTTLEIEEFLKMQHRYPYLSKGSRIKTKTNENIIKFLIKSNRFIAI